MKHEEKNFPLSFLVCWFQLFPTFLPSLNSPILCQKGKKERGNEVVVRRTKTVHLVLLGLELGLDGLSDLGPTLGGPRVAGADGVHGLTEGVGGGVARNGGEEVGGVENLGVLGGNVHLEVLEAGGLGVVAEGPGNGGVVVSPVVVLGLELPGAVNLEGGERNASRGSDIGMRKGKGEQVAI